MATIEEIIDKIDQLKNPLPIFDPVVKQAISNAKQRLVDKTPVGFTGKAKASWEAPDQKGPSSWLIRNQSATDDKIGRAHV